MAEYINRYDRLAVFLAEKGILVTGNDHLGHGKSIYKNMEEAGNGAGSLEGSVPYRQALPEYREAAVEAAQDADLPAYARQWVETYFNALAQ